MSTKFSPTAVWRMRASLGPGLPTSTSSQTKTSGPPVLWKRMACVMEKTPWGKMKRIKDVAAGSGLDDDVAVLDVHRKGLGDIGTFCQCLAILDHDRIGADLDSF